MRRRITIRTNVKENTTRIWPWAWKKKREALGGIIWCLPWADASERYEKLPLVQDKALLDNILYSGVWVNYRGKRKEEAANDG